MLICSYICGVIVSVLASSEVDRGFEHRSGQTQRVGLVQSGLHRHIIEI
jgi:hypothetical protein